MLTTLETKLKEKVQMEHVSSSGMHLSVGHAENKTQSLCQRLKQNMSAANCCSQVLWIRNQLEDFSKRYTNIPVFCDNTSAINLSKNSIQHSRSKHIEIKHHFIRDHVNKSEIELIFVDTKNQLADIFTKPLVEDRFNFIKNKLNITQNPHKK